MLLLVLAAALQPVRAETLLVLGDSLSAARGIDRDEGWVNLLRQRLASEAPGEHTVINASISGDTTAGGLERLPEALETHHPDIVLLELGGNDGLQGLPPDRMQDNLAQMIEKSQASGARVALLGILIPPNYGQAYTKAFADVFPTLASQYDVPLVPFILEGVVLNDKLMQPDRIHPNAQGQPIMLDNIWPTVASMLDEASSGDTVSASRP
ncbi:arylesterase [Kushneria pakistanensis]|uniref:Arylesterase n=2 Tax=Kushneria pakistanensis TaxID=1508770 RepID=A0ABQ3FMJ9_9GAMM|nr:arylesterase [Kushneria pakistanensis]GHC29806.1 arylesterase [Kushneria pakistanensis]